MNWFLYSLPGRLDQLAILPDWSDAPTKITLSILPGLEPGSNTVPSLPAALTNKIFP